MTVVARVCFSRDVSEIRKKYTFVKTVFRVKKLGQIVMVKNAFERYVGLSHEHSSTVDNTVIVRLLFYHRIMIYTDITDNMYSYAICNKHLNPVNKMEIF